MAIPSKILKHLITTSLTFPRVLILLQDDLLILTATANAKMVELVTITATRFATLALKQTCTYGLFSVSVNVEAVDSKLLRKQEVHRKVLEHSGTRYRT